MRTFTFAFGVAVAFGADAAAACSCLEPDDIPSLLGAADQAFAGRVVDVEDYDLGDADDVDDAPCGDGQPHRVVVVEVTRVWKGDVPQRMSFLSILGGGSACGLTMFPDEPEQVFFTREDEGFPAPRANICTTPNADADTVEALATSAPPRPGSDDRAEICRRRIDPPPSGSCSAASGSSTLLGLALLALLRRRARRTAIHNPG